MSLFSECGRKCEDLKQDLSSTLLMTLKSCQDSICTATLFKDNFSISEKIMSLLVASKVEILLDRFSIEFGKIFHLIKNIFTFKQQFKHFPAAPYATDVNFHHINRWHENHTMIRTYFNSSHHL